MGADFPEECVQACTGPWWAETSDATLRPGLLVRAYIPHLDTNPRTLIPQGRPEDQRDHHKAQFKLAPLRIRDVQNSSKLPVAALPQREGEVYGVYRTKLRPAIVLTPPQPAPPKHLQLGGSKWQWSSTVLVIPAYGVEKSDRRAGWPLQFVERIQRAEYPNYIWDKLPRGLAGGSVLRLDQITPIGTDGSSYESRGWCLSDEALELFREWVDWYRSGDSVPPEESALAAARALLVQS